MTDLRRESRTNGGPQGPKGAQGDGGRTSFGSPDGDGEGCQPPPGAQSQWRPRALGRGSHRRDLAMLHLSPSGQVSQCKVGFSPRDEYNRIPAPVVERDQRLSSDALRTAGWARRALVLQARTGEFPGEPDAARDPQRGLRAAGGRGSKAWSGGRGGGAARGRRRLVLVAAAEGVLSDGLQVLAHVEHHLTAGRGGEHVVGAVGILADA